MPEPSTWRHSGRHGRRAVAELYATLVIVALAISMSYIVYSELSKTRSSPQATFINQVTVVVGDPSFLYLRVNSSEPTSLTYFQLDNLSSSPGGALAIGADGRYVDSPSLCARGLLTFFSADSQSQSSQLSVDSDGEVWIAGFWRSSSALAPGFSEVMVDDGTYCRVLLPGGSVSPLPVSDAGSGALDFTFFIPIAGGSHSLLLVFTGGDDRVGFSA